MKTKLQTVPESRKDSIIISTFITFIESSPIGFLSTEDEKRKINFHKIRLFKKPYIL